MVKTNNIEGNNTILIREEINSSTQNKWVSGGYLCANIPDRLVDLKALHLLLTTSLHRDLQNTKKKQTKIHESFDHVTIK